MLIPRWPGAINESSQLLEIKIASNRIVLHIFNLRRAPNKVWRGNYKQLSSLNVMRKITNIKYIKSWRCHYPMFFVFLFFSFNWGCPPSRSWGLLLFLQAPDIDKEETKRRRLSHVHVEQNTWEKWPGGGSTAPQNTSWESRGREKKRDLGTERRLWQQYLIWSLGHGVCHGHARPPSTTDTSAGQHPGRGEVWGGDSGAGDQEGRTEHRLSWKAKSSLDVWL